MTIVDLSHRLGPGMPSYPGLPEPRFETFFTHAESVERGLYAEGAAFQIATYALGGNTGTYVDAPFHRHADMADLSGLRLEQLADLPGLVVRAGDGAIGPDAFAGRDLRGKAVLVRTDWSKRWGGDDYFRSGPYLTAAACELLVERGAVLVGVDFANVDDMNTKSRPAHTLLLGSGMAIVEHLCALDRLPDDRFRFFAVPPAIAGGTSFPVRAFALV
jgi:kynurenine formamidase